MGRIPAPKREGRGIVLKTAPLGSYRDLLLLAEHDVVSTGVTMAEVIEVVEGVLRQKGLGAVEMAPRAGLYPRPESFTQALLAHIPAANAAGAKIVSVFPMNRGTSLPVTTAMIVLTDPGTGAPLAMMDGTWITTMRTGAVTAVAAKHLASSDSRIVAIIGAGVQGRGNLLALKTALPSLAEARVCDINPDAGRKFADDLSRSTALKIRYFDSCREAIEGADIVVTATAVFKQRTVLVARDWVKPGALIAPLEVDTALDASLVYRDNPLFVDDIEQTLAFRAMGCFAEGTPNIHGELGDVIAGKKIGRRKMDEIIVSMNVGLAIEDIAVGQFVFQRALQRNIGHRLS